MLKIIKEINLDVTKPNLIEAVVAKQNDMNSRFLKVTLTDCGKRIDIPKRDTTEVTINAKRENGEADSFYGDINDDGTVTVPLHSWMLELDGSVVCDISVVNTATDNPQKLSTTSFTLKVEEAAYGDGDISTDPQYSILVDLIEQVEGLLSQTQSIESALGGI